MQLGRRLRPPQQPVSVLENRLSLIALSPVTRFKSLTTKGTFAEVSVEPEWAVLATRLVSLAGQEKFFDGQSVTIRHDEVILSLAIPVVWVGMARVNVPDEEESRGSPGGVGYLGRWRVRRPADC